MQKKLVAGSLLTALSITFMAGDCLASEADETQAVGAATKWLSLVDNGQYKQSWEQSASLFKSHITEAQWASQVGAARTPLGKVISRKLLSKQYAKTLPGAPDGQYVVVQYTTNFQKKNSAVETVTPMKDKGGQWKVSGYYIR